MRDGPASICMPTGALQSSAPLCGRLPRLPVGATANMVWRTTINHPPLRSWWLYSTVQSTYIPSTVPCPLARTGPSFPAVSTRETHMDGMMSMMVARHRHTTRLTRHSPFFSLPAATHSNVVTPSRGRMHSSRSSMEPPSWPDDLCHSLMPFAIEQICESVDHVRSRLSASFDMDHGAPAA